MGYYSRFEISTDPQLPGKNVSEDYEVVLEKDGSYQLYDSKWYDYKKEILKFSRENPNSLITVHRYGEEPGDIEVSFFKDGCSYDEQLPLFLPKFDKKKLK